MNECISTAAKKRRVEENNNEPPLPPLPPPPKQNSKEALLLSEDLIVDGLVPFVKDCRTTCNNVSVASKTIHESIHKRIALPWPQNVTLNLNRNSNDISIIESVAVSGPEGNEGYIAAVSRSWQSESKRYVRIWNCQTGKQILFDMTTQYICLSDICFLLQIHLFITGSLPFYNNVKG